MASICLSFARVSSGASGLRRRCCGFFLTNPWKRFRASLFAASIPMPGPFSCSRVKYRRIRSRSVGSSTNSTSATAFKNIGAQLFRVPKAFAKACSIWNTSFR